MKLIQLTSAVVCSLCAAISYAQPESLLSLAEAERIAIKRDLVLQSQQAEEKAAAEQSVAADSWADPTIKFGALAVPVDTYDLEQEQMTQVVIGYQQMLPRGDSAEIKSKKWSAQAGLLRHAQQLRQAMLHKMVRKAWLMVYLKQRERDIIQSNVGLFKQLVTVSQSQYVAGRKKQQDVLQAEVELSLVEDQLEKAESELDVATATLAKWIGDEPASRKLNADNDFLGHLMLSEQQFSPEQLLKHPLVLQHDSKITMAEHDVALATEKNSTQWGFDITYGIRQGENPVMAGGGERPDFLSLMAMVKVPMFTADKQDREIIASKQQRQSKQYQRQDVLRELNTELQQLRSRWFKTVGRIARYEEKLLPQAKQNARAAMSAYQSGVGSFTALTRARVSEFKAQLSHIKLKIEKASVLADIRYLLGEE